MMINRTQWKRTNTKEHKQTRASCAVEFYDQIQSLNHHCCLKLIKVFLQKLPFQSYLPKCAINSKAKSQIN